jgi:hypothetical protein
MVACTAGGGRRAANHGTQQAIKEAKERALRCSPKCGVR